MDDDILASAKTLADQRGMSVGAVLSELARKGLASVASSKVRNGIQLFPLCEKAGLVTPELIKALTKKGD